MPEPFFIVGNDRSGTTMLRLIVDRGPDAAVPPESMFLTDFAAAFESGGPRDERAARQLMREVWEHPKVRLWQLPSQPPAIPPGLDPPDTYRFIAAAPFEAYAALHGKQRWGDKTPHYVHHIDHLLRLWPQARVVVLVRDGRDVALSLRGMPFGPNNAWAAAQWWARGIRAGARAQREHPGAVVTVRYEDLARRPHEEVPRLCDFLGLRYPTTCSRWRSPTRPDRARPGRLVPDAVRGHQHHSIGRWERAMSRRDQRIFAALAGDELEQLGYDVAPGPPAASRRGRRAGSATTTS